MDEFITEEIIEPIQEIIIPQIIEENGFIYEQTNENGCISRIQTGVVIPEQITDLGEIIPERIEPIMVEAIPVEPTLEEKVEILTEKVEILEMLS